MLRLSHEYWKLNIHDKATWRHWLKNLWAVSPDTAIVSKSFVSDRWGAVHQFGRHFCVHRRLLGRGPHLVRSRHWPYRPRSILHVNSNQRHPQSRGSKTPPLTGCLNWGMRMASRLQTDHFYQPNILRLYCVLRASSTSPGCLTVTSTSHHTGRQQSRPRPGARSPRTRSVSSAAAGDELYSCGFCLVTKHASRMKNDACSLASAVQTH